MHFMVPCFQLLPRTRSARFRNGLVRHAFRWHSSSSHPVIVGHYPFASSHIRLAAEVLATARNGNGQVEDVLDVVASHGWDLISDGRRFQASGWCPYAIRQGQTVMILFHGTDISDWRQVLSAAQSTALGFVAHALYLEALCWTKWILNRHRPQKLILGGFSQGGALAEMMSVHFTAVRDELPRCVEESCAITFDSPSFPLLSFLETIYAFDGAFDSNSILQIKSAPHAINTAYPPLGEVRRVKIPHVEDEDYRYSDILWGFGSAALDVVPIGYAAKAANQSVIAGMAASATIGGPVAGKAACTRTYQQLCWFWRQHNMELFFRHLDEQYSVVRWPSRSKIVTPSLDDVLFSWRDFVPVVGPLWHLVDKVYDKEWRLRKQWRICREDERCQIENRVLNTPDFLQEGMPIAYSDWGKICSTPKPEFKSFQVGLKSMQATG